MTYADLAPLQAKHTPDEPAIVQPVDRLMQSRNDEQLRVIVTNDKADSTLKCNAGFKSVCQAALTRLIGFVSRFAPLKALMVLPRLYMMCSIAGCEHGLERAACPAEPLLTNTTMPEEETQ